MRQFLRHWTAGSAGPWPWEKGDSTRYFLNEKQGLEPTQTAGVLLIRGRRYWRSGLKFVEQVTETGRCTVGNEELMKLRLKTLAVGWATNSKE